MLIGKFHVVIETLCVFINWLVLHLHNSWDLSLLYLQFDKTGIQIKTSLDVTLDLSKTKDYTFYSYNVIKPFISLSNKMETKTANSTNKAADKMLLILSKQKYLKLNRKLIQIPDLFYIISYIKYDKLEKTSINKNTDLNLNTLYISLQSVD